ncbi:MAG TPA: ATP-binding protein [Gemmatimonadaceae bacterium]
MRARRATVAGWIIWCSLLAFATAVLFSVRQEIDQVHVVLPMLLIVLGGTVAGGRALGFTLACASFALIDYFFQPPYDRVSVSKPLDVVVLLAFLGTAGVTAHLLTRAREEATRASQRASEVESLSRLGAATLRYAEPTAALDAVCTLVRDTVEAGECVILTWDPTFGLLAADPGTVPLAVETSRVAECAAEYGMPVSTSVDGQLAQQSMSRFANDATPALHTRLLALPLRAEDRTIGVLVLRGSPVLLLDAPKRRLLAALTYYAALGIERMRLMREASHSEALREANRAKDQILASVSHDLRTPLTTIKVLAQGAQARGEPSAAAIVEQADRLARMVRDLLELSRLRAGSFASNPELNTAEDLVGAALRQAQGVLNGQVIQPHVDLTSPALVGVFDFVHTLRILGNLLDNALRYTPPGGVVDLWVAREGAELVFTVADRGVGVAPPERERIFDAFYRPSGSTPDTGHAGLGLSIARTLAELQGGTLTYAIREGGGSEFTLRLPAADLKEEATGAELEHA